MIDTILSLIGGIKGLIIGGLGLFGGLWAIWQRRTINKQKDTISQQTQVIKGHEAKEKVHVKDQEVDVDADNKVDNLREQVEHAGNQEAAAGQVGSALNGYFGADKK